MKRFMYISYLNAYDMSVRTVERSILHYILVFSPPKILY